MTAVAALMEWFAAAQAGGGRVAERAPAAAGEVMNAIRRPGASRSP